MNHLKTTLYSLALLILVGFVFGQAATTRAYSGQGPYTYIKTISFSPATTESTKVNLTFDWNTNWVPSNVSLYYDVDTPNVWAHRIDFFPFWSSLTIDLGALSAGTHTIGFMLFGSNVNAGSGWTLWTVTYNPMSFNVNPPPPPPPPNSSLGMFFTASPTTVPYGWSTQLFWMAFGASSCTASGSWSGTKPSSGFESNVVQPLRREQLPSHCRRARFRGEGLSIAASQLRRTVNRVWLLQHSAPRPQRWRRAPATWVP